MQQPGKFSKIIPRMGGGFPGSAFQTQSAKIFCIALARAFEAMAAPHLERGLSTGY